ESGYATGSKGDDRGGAGAAGDVANTAAGSGSAYDVDLAESKNKRIDDQLVAQEQQHAKQQDRDARDGKKTGAKSDAPARPASHEGIVVQTPKTPAMTPKDTPAPAKVAVADPNADEHPAASDRADNTAGQGAAAGSGAAPGGAPTTNRPTNGTVG